MIDIELIRTQPERVQQAAKHKKVDVDIQHFLKLDEKRKKLQSTLDELQAQRNALARTGKQGKPTDEHIQTGKALRQQSDEVEHELTPIQTEWQLLLEKIPNLPSDDTPIGDSEADNVVLRQIGKVPQFDFTPKEHWELGSALGIIDNERAADVSGSRFTYLKGELVWLEFALLQLAFSVLTSEKELQQIADQAGLTVAVKPFLPVIPPVLIKPDVMQRMARLEPKEERYYIPSDDVYLVGSAEHTLGPLHMDETIEEDKLPLRYVGFSSAFRRESGSYGKDVRGILRLHQFDKLEIESFSLPEQSINEQDFIVAIQEYLMQLLKLPYQVVLKCTADMGSPNARAIDIETWMPGQGKYRETHTSDLMTDYQARRLRTKVKRGEGTKQFVHMNDATVFAIGRLLIGIMENYQQADGSIIIPEALHRYLPFTTIAHRSY